MASVLITGASGFIGHALCRRFLAAGWAVTGVINRTPMSEPGVRSLPLGDLSGVANWDPVLKDVDVVVHAAARVHVTGRAGRATADFQRVNSKAPAALAWAAALAGVRRFVYLSSAKVLGEASGGRPLCDKDIPQPGDAYAISKWEAEKALWEVAAQSGMEMAVLRPPLVYGPGVKANFLALLRLADTPWPVPFGAVHNRRSLVYVENLADACICAAAIGGPQGTWLVSDGVPVSTTELIQCLRQNMGRPSRLVSLSAPLVQAIGRAFGAGRAVDRLCGSFEVDSSRFERDFAWMPPWSAEKAMAETVTWYKNR